MGITMASKMTWYTYIVECSDSTLYTGITNDLQRRVEEHNNDEKGAKYTRSRRPVKLVYSEGFASRSEAAKREASIKSMGVEEKRELFAE